MDKILDGKALSKTIRREIKEKIDQIKEKTGETIGLAIIQVGDDNASSTYVRNKTKACEEAGIDCYDYKFPVFTGTEEIHNLILELNNTECIHGILVQLPLPSHINTTKIIQSISYQKDVDCFNLHNIGCLYNGTPIFEPCTPAGIIELLKRNNIEIKGKECVVIGRSNIVGKPLSYMLMRENGTVTTAHSFTSNLFDVCKRADILVSAIGYPKVIDHKYIKKDAVIIDVGINRDMYGKLCGDVDFEKVYSKCSKITPVPGGVGPMTITMLLNNCYKAYCYIKGINNK